MRRTGAFLFALIAGLSFSQTGCAQEKAVHAPAATREAVEPKQMQVAVFSGGCYWGVEGTFSHVIGVTSAVSGFQGGAAKSVSYEQVSGGTTGFAEAVRVTYDPAKIRYDQLLRIFFSVIADPTTLNRQGPDEGTQYRSALVPLSAEQKAVAQAYLAQLAASKLWRGPIVTKIEPWRGFIPAAADHQDFMFKNPRHGYITYWDAPKVAALKAMYPGFYKADFTRD